MKRLVLILLWLTLGVALSAQELTLSQLNQKVLELEKRIKLLEKALLAQSRTPANSTNIQIPADRAVWRRLKKRMSEEDVKKILGEPIRISVDGPFTTWIFDNGSIRFYRDRLDSWIEP